MKKVRLLIVLLILFLALVSDWLNLYTLAQKNTNPISDRQNKNEIILIVVDNILIGGYQEKKWVTVDLFVDKLKDTRTYQVYTIEQYLGLSQGKQPVLDDEFESFYYVEIDNTGTNNDQIALGSKVPFLFKKPKVYKKAFYENLTREYFSKMNLLKFPINVTQGLSVDLDNDNFEEHIICISNFSIKDSIINGYFKTNTSYSYILIAKSHGKSYKIINVWEAKKSTLNREMAEELNANIGEKVIFRSLYMIIGIIDITSDGIMEIVCKEEVQEGIIYNIFEYKGGVFKKVISAGTGL